MLNMKTSIITKVSIFFRFWRFASDWSSFWWKAASVANGTTMKLTTSSPLELTSTLVFITYCPFFFHFLKIQLYPNFYQTTKPRDGWAFADFGATADQSKPAKMEKGSGSNGRSKKTFQGETCWRGWKTFQNFKTNCCSATFRWWISRKSIIFLSFNYSWSRWGDRYSWRNYARSKTEKITVFDEFINKLQIWKLSGQVVYEFLWADIFRF